MMALAAFNRNHKNQKLTLKIFQRVETTRRNNVYYTTGTAKKKKRKMSHALFHAKLANCTFFAVPKDLQWAYLIALSKNNRYANKEHGNVSITVVVKIAIF